MTICDVVTTGPKEPRQVPSGTVVRLVEVDGARMLARISGVRGELPVIVLESGGGGTSAWWAWVQRRLAERTLVVSYDRAGLGGSGEVVPAEIGPEAVARRLAALLATIAGPGPYVLVGHSLGALFVRYFAATRPDAVAAVVMVDATPSDATMVTEVNSRMFRLFVRVIGVLRWVARTGLLRRFNPAAGLVADLPPREQTDALAATASGRHLDAFCRELAAIRAIQATATAAGFPSRIPLLVASAEKRSPTSPILAHHCAVAAMSRHGRHLTIDGATHGSIVTDPRHAAELAEHILTFVAQQRSIREGEGAG